MTGFEKFVEAMASGDMSFRDTAIRDEVGDFIIDTVWAVDCGWETGILKKELEENWIIVEEYPNQEKAVKGHEKWIKSIKENPNQELKECRTAEEWFFGNKY